MRCLTLSESLGICALLLTTIFGVSALCLSEFRRWLGLDKPVSPNLSENTKLPKLAEILAVIIIVILILLMVFLLVWFIWCRIPDAPQKPKKIPPTPTATQAPTPSSTPVVSKRPPSVVIDGTKFELYVFNSDYYWVAGTEIVHSLKGTMTDEEMIDYLKDIHGDLKNQDAIVCIGTASNSVTLKGRPYEEGRAEKRAKLIVDWMRKVFVKVDRSPALYQLNLGYYTEPPDRDDQRLIIIIGVQRIESDAPAIKDILSKGQQELLKQKLREKGFPFEFDKYTLFDLTPKS
jgi:hypothetical protein